MSVYHSRAAHLLDVGDVVLVTPELGRHRKASVNDQTVHLTVREMRYQVGHHVELFLHTGDRLLIPPDMIVKVLA